MYQFGQASIQTLSGRLGSNEEGDKVAFNEFSFINGILFSFGGTYKSIGVSRNQNLN